MIVWLSGLVTLPSIIWIAGILKWLARSVRKSGSYHHVDVSVVVVARNEERTITECLQSIIGQSAPAIELFLMDDASTDGTLARGQEIAQKNSIVHVETLSADEHRASPKKHALSIAYSKLSGERVALTDADCVVPPCWLECLASEFDSRTGAVIGASWPDKPVYLSERIYRWERLVANTLMASACGWGNPASACGHSIVYSREALSKVDAPVRRDLPSGDDDLTIQAVAKAGYGVSFCSQAGSVVRDAGGLRGSRWSQAARHQNVTHLYPARWRLLFAATILSNLASIFLILLLPFSEYPKILSISVAVKIVIDSFSGLLLSRKLKLDISASEILFASLLLPLWAVWRAVAGTFGKSFDWRGRNMRASHTSTSASSI